MIKVKIRKCKAFRDSVNFLGTNSIFQKKLLSLKSLHDCTFSSTRGTLMFNKRTGVIFHSSIEYSWKWKLVLSRDAFIASRESIFLGIFWDTVVSQIVYFLFLLGWCPSDQSREKWTQFWEFDNAWLVNHRDFFDSTHLTLFSLSFVSKEQINIILIRKVMKKLP